LIQHHIAKMQESQQSSMELSNTKLSMIEKSRENFQDFRKFLRERTLLQKQNQKHEQQVIATAIASTASITKSTTSNASSNTFSSNTTKMSTQRSTQRKPETLTAHISTTSTTTDFKQQEEAINGLYKDEKVPRYHNYEQKYDDNYMWNQLFENRKKRREPQNIDHCSLNVLLHESAMKEAHKKIAAVSSARGVSGLLMGVKDSSGASSSIFSETPAVSAVPITDWILRLDIDSATGFLRADTDMKNDSLSGVLNNYKNLYAIVKLNGKKIAHTLTVENSLDPVWDFHKDVCINVKDLAPLTKWSECTLSIEVYNEDYHKSDDFLGCVNFDGNDLEKVFNSKKKTYTLQSRGKSLSNEIKNSPLGTITFDIKLIEKRSTNKIEVASDSDDDDESNDVDDYAAAAIADKSSSKYKLLPRSALHDEKTESFRQLGSSHRSSIELVRTRRKASAMSLQDMLRDEEDGDVSLTWLMSVPLFADLTTPEINALRDALVAEEFDDGHVIIREGNKDARKFYIIQSGKVSVLKTIKGVEKLVNTMTPGQTFGERALLIEGEARAATCKASGSVTCLVLDRETFANMLGSSTTLIDENYQPGRGNDPDAAGLTKHIERFSELIKWFSLASEEGNRDNILEAGLCLELHKLFSPELRPKDIIERTISAMYKLFDAERVGLFLVDHETKQMVLAVSLTARYLKLPLTGIAGYVATSGTFDNIKDCYADPRFDQSMDKSTGFRTRTMVTCPLKNETGEVVAVIQLINKKSGEVFNAVGIEEGGENESKWQKGARAIRTASRFVRKAKMMQKTTDISMVDNEKKGEIKRSSLLADSTISLQEKIDRAKRTGKTITGAKGRGGRVIRGRTLDDARKRKRKEMDNKPVPWPTFTAEDCKLLLKIAEQLEPVISEARAHKPNKDFKCLRNLDYNLLVNVESCENVRKFVRTGPKDKETGLRTGPVLVRPIPKGKKIEVTLALYHGEKMLHDRCTTTSALVDTDGNVVWDEKLIHSCTLSCLPRATRLIFFVHKPGKGPDGTNKPVGWGGLSAMDFRDALVTGKHRLRLWPGACLSPTVPILQPVKDDNAAGFLNLTFPSFDQEVRYYEVDDEELSDHCREIGMSHGERRRAKIRRRDSSKRFSVDLSGMSDEVKLDGELHRIIYHTALTELSEEEQKLVWQARDRLTKIPISLPKVLLSVKWDQPDDVGEMHTLLYMWEKMEPLQALQLLDSRFPDPKVRAYAVQLLDELGDDELRPYLLQLVQCLKHEAYHDSALSRFLVCRAIQNADHIGHILYWLLKSEVHIDVVRDRFSLILAEYLRAVEPEIRTELGHQGFVMRRLVAIAKDINACESGKAARKKLLHERLRATALPATFQLPLSPDVICDGIRIEECRVMDSKKKPLWLVFDAIEWKEMYDDCGEKSGGSRSPGHFKFPVLFKAGDDLRQDQLTLQLLSIMDNLWKGAGMDLHLSPYACVATGDQIGFLEVVQHSTTLASVVKNNTSLSRGKKGIMAKFSAAKKAVYNKDYIKVWLEAEARESMVTGIVHNPLLLSDRQRSDVKQVDNKPKSDPVANLNEFNKRFMLS
jgi:hypothetical protein